MHALGLDFGTSGARACICGADGEPRWQWRIEWNSRQAMDPQCWQQALDALLAAIPPELGATLHAIAIDATSGTAVLTDSALHPITPVLPYFQPLPAQPGARLDWLLAHDTAQQARHLLHQADWLNSRLLGRTAPSDWHNALKTGYDPVRLEWQKVLQQHPARKLLPDVVAPGSLLGRLDAALAQRFGLDPACEVRAGTTDSTAAALAAGLLRPGDALTSLGSTLTVKVVSLRPIVSPIHGVYSHRLGEFWLAGGASNSGGAVLRQFFDDAQLRDYSCRIDPLHDSPLDYYPLPAQGERFPRHDPQLEPRLTPRPTEPVAFLHGLLQGMAHIEREGYQLLESLGAPPPRRVFTAGGGSRNPQWMKLRERLLGVPVTTVEHSEAATGSARLALGRLAPPAALIAE